MLMETALGFGQIKGENLCLNKNTNVSNATSCLRLLSLRPEEYVRLAVGRYSAEGSYYAPAITVAGAEVFYMWKYIEKIDWCKVCHRFLGLKHKALEIQAAYFGTDVFDINCSWRRRQEHAGMSFEITLLGVLVALGGCVLI